MKFKIGDKVKILNAGVDSDKIGQTREVVRIDDRGNIYLYGCECYWSNENNLQLITTNKKSIMKTLNTMMKKLLDADTQTLLKTEYINGDLELTTKGKDTLLSMLFMDKKADLVKLAQEEIAEEEKNKK